MRRREGATRASFSRVRFGGWSRLRVQSLQKEVVLKAIADNYRAFAFADDSLKNDKGRGRRPLNATVFRLLDVSFQSDRDVVLAAVTRDGTVLGVVDETFMSVREIVAKGPSSLAKRLVAIRFLPLRDDIDLALLAITQDGICHPQRNSRRHATRQRLRLPSCHPQRRRARIFFL